MSNVIFDPCFKVNLGYYTKMLSITFTVGSRAPKIVKKNLNSKSWPSNLFQLTVLTYDDLEAWVIKLKWPYISYYRSLGFEPCFHFSLCTWRDITTVGMVLATGSVQG